MKAIMKYSTILVTRSGQPLLAKKYISYLLKWPFYDKKYIVSIGNICNVKHENYIINKFRNYSDYIEKNYSNRKIEENNQNKKPLARGAKLNEEFAMKEQYWENLVDLEYLEEKDIKILEAHRQAVVAGHFTYDDPETGLRVMTRLRHFLRRTCCGNACRHCIYDHENVPEELKEHRVYNSAFWVNKWELKRPLSEEKMNINNQPDSSIDLLFRKSQEKEEEEEFDPQLFKH
ncbi:unnamed protein product [Meganyctiphanes norvegica]|uniref:Uncharacterized protein n=1 Tax=Meganyctiphanes norvegica TaxID=48144 RepID=A0AAV2SL10_MEGNR